MQPPMISAGSGPRGPWSLIVASRCRVEGRPFLLFLRRKNGSEFWPFYLTRLKYYRRTRRKKLADLFLDRHISSIRFNFLERENCKPPNESCKKLDQLGIQPPHCQFHFLAHQLLSFLFLGFEVNSDLSLTVFVTIVED